MMDIKMIKTYEENSYKIWEKKYHESDVSKESSKNI
jgi:hypothetical protein